MHAYTTGASIIQQQQLAGASYSSCPPNTRVLLAVSRRYLAVSEEGWLGLTSAVADSRLPPEQLFVSVHY